jgi:type I restriction-modification system DNA methylase subunit
MSSCAVGAIWIFGVIVGLFVLSAFAPTIILIIEKWKNKPKKKSPLQSMSDDDEYDRRV